MTEKHPKNKQTSVFFIIFLEYLQMCGIGLLLLKKVKWQVKLKLLYIFLSKMYFSNNLLNYLNSVLWTITFFLLIYSIIRFFTNTTCLRGIHLQ